MRLTVTQLRQIIAEEIARVDGLEALDPDKIPSSYKQLPDNVKAVVKSAYDQFFEIATYNENEPDTAWMGKESWDAQATKAAEVFVEELSIKALERLENSTAPVNLSSADITAVRTPILKRLFRGDFAYEV